jgi:hypothetical protein
LRELAADVLTLGARISSTGLDGGNVSQFSASLSPACAGSKIKWRFNPKLAKPRMGLSFCHLLRRLIEGWILRSSRLKHEIQKIRQPGWGSSADTAFTHGSRIPLHPFPLPWLVNGKAGVEWEMR